MSLLVRRAEPQDAPVVARVHRLLAAGLQGTTSPGVPGRTLRRGQDQDLGESLSQLPGQAPTNLVAELDGQITAIGWFALGQQLAATQAVGAAIVLRCRYRIGPAEVRLLDLNRA